MNRADTMQTAVQRYLDERHRLGFSLKSPGTELMRFARFADARDHQGPLTLDLQLDWAREHVARTSTVTAARRLEVVRPFATYYRQFEPATEVPPPFILGHGHRRLAPHIYTDQEIGDLLTLSDRMTPPGGMRPLTYKTLFGLIAATGLRISEALNLQVKDIDLPMATLTVRQTKLNIGSEVWLSMPEAWTKVSQPSVMTPTMTPQKTMPSATNGMYRWIGTLKISA